jgi:hypothetical protein
VASACSDRLFDDSVLIVVPVSNRPLMNAVL